MLKSHAFRIAIVTMLVPLGSPFVFGGVDWLGQCWDGKKISDTTKRPKSKCVNLSDCGKKEAFDCTGNIGKCTNDKNINTKAKESRVIQFGTCTSSTKEEPCWFCDDKKLICHVVYHYEMIQNGECVNRCLKPEVFTTTDDVNACKP